MLPAATAHLGPRQRGLVAVEPRLEWLLEALDSAQPEEAPGDAARPEKRRAPPRAPPAFPRSRIPPILPRMEPVADRLESRLAFETLISDTSAQLLVASPERMRLAVEQALERVREFFQADRCALLSVGADRQNVHVRLASYAEGVLQVPPDVDLATLFPWSRQRLLVEREPIRIAKRADLPPEADVERASWDLLSIRSTITLPIETGDGSLHLIALQTVREERDWPDSYLSRLRVLAEMLVVALRRGDLFLELRQAETRASLAAESAEAGLWQLDTATRVIWATGQARAIFGYAPDEEIGLERFKASVHSDDWNLVEAAIDRALREPAAVSVEYRIRRDDGGLRWVGSTGRRLSVASGEPPRLAGVCVDVTERRSAQDALRRSEANLASGAELAGLGFYEVDLGDRVASFDHRFREICGIPQDPTPGFRGFELWLSRLHPDDRPRVLEIRERMHEGKTDQISTEYRYLHPQEGEKWIHHLARVSRRDPAGRAVVTHGVVRDVTQRRRTEDDLRQLSRRLIRAHEEERALLARELHDDVTQRLAVLAIDVGQSERGAKDATQAAAMRSVRDGLARLSEDIHAMAYQLHPSVLAELGLHEALRTECERFRRRGSVQLSLDIDPDTPAVGKDGALCLFRVAQEALNNVLRHARARAVHVVLRQMDGGLLLSVRDDGAGFDPATARQGRSLGLLSMRERLHLVDGTLDVESAPGQGTAIVAWIPTQGASR